MPFIDIKTTSRLTPAKEEIVKTRMGEAISVLNKDSKWLMVNISDNCKMYFSDNKKAPTAFVDVSVYGKLDPDKCALMTPVVCDIMLSELGVPKDRVYVKYSETDIWGWNDSNF